jgi:hypothetical protein
MKKLFDSFTIQFLFYLEVKASQDYKSKPASNCLTNQIVWCKSNFLINL